MGLTMNPDIEYLNLCKYTYNAVPTFTGRNGSRAGLRLINNIPSICFPGTKTLWEWFLDFIAIPAIDLNTFNHAKLGPIPLGFMSRVHDIEDSLKEQVKKPYSITGHSLGGAMAVIYGAQQAIDGNPPVEIVTFDAPRGLSDLGVNALKNVPVRQYRFGADVVSLVPTRPFSQARLPLLQVGKPIISSHFIEDNHHLDNFIPIFEQE